MMLGCVAEILPRANSKAINATGVWRVRYENGHEVDASGKMPSGETFRDLAGLKEIMIRGTSLFSRNLTEKLLTDATGRSMEIGDRPEVDRIVAELDGKGSGLKDLVFLVVEGPIFGRK